MWIPNPHATPNNTPLIHSLPYRVRFRESPLLSSYREWFIRWGQEISKIPDTCDCCKSYNNGNKRISFIIHSLWMNIWFKHAILKRHWWTASSSKNSNKAKSTEITIGDKIIHVYKGLKQLFRIISFLEKQQPRYGTQECAFLLADDFFPPTWTHPFICVIATLMLAQDKP